MRQAITTALLGYFARLRFPTLLGLTAILFLANLVVPDFIPFADEILLGLVTLVLANWKKRELPDTPSAAASGQRPPIDITPSRGGRDDPSKPR